MEDVLLLVSFLVSGIQVGIKYSGKADVDISSLEIELREPYKVGLVPFFVRGGFPRKTSVFSLCLRIWLIGGLIGVSCLFTRVNA